jgi:hypothetical protein
MITEHQLFDYVGPDAIHVATNCWKKAWDEIRGPYNHPDHSQRIRSDLLREHAAIHGKRDLAPLGFRFLFDEGQFMFIGNACMVFRKLDDFQQPHRPTTGRGKKLHQSTLIDDLPTLFVGMALNGDGTDYAGIFLCHPNESGKGMAWTVNITNGIVAADADQSKFIDLIDETEKQDEKKPKPKKFKPKNDKNTGDSSEEASPGGGPAS